MQATKKPTGRPPFKPTPQQRRRVAIAASAGMRHEDIAIGIGITRPTLYKYFEEELSVGALRKRMEVIEAMHAAAKKGSSSAARVILALEPQLAAPPANKDQPSAPAEAGGEKLGKKAAANEAAKSAHIGTDWDELLRGPAAAPMQ